MEELEVHRGQITDKELNDAIDRILLHEVWVNLSSTLLMVAPVVRDIDASSIVSPQVVVERLKPILIQVKDQLQQVNKRIEELLSGDDGP